MPKRDANDGGQTAFTEHRIQRRPIEQFTDGLSAATMLIRIYERNGETAQANNLLKTLAVFSGEQK